MSRYITSFVVALSVLFSASTLAGQSAMGCINVQQDGDKTYFKNSCNYKVTVAWCSTTRKINGKRCGQTKSDWNKYYTQMFVLDGYEKDYKWQTGDVRYAACKGFINGWDAEGKFSSDRGGRFSCTN
ncbi:hypothetical protein [uncultured Photobacterium sp.]|uniref:hypothetical protein n=1 Tax=uncultured Photobacterium sp. TaxID=173973 RepID=UPI0026348222|nr:hypothetical protein [uncultured Photobacterium sp.]